MDWSAIERAVDREASSFNRNNSGFLASTPLSRPATPSRTSFDSRSILGGQTGSYDRFDPRAKENYLQIHTNLPSASSTPREQANDLKASLPPNPPGRYSTMLSDEMSDMRRMVIAQNSRLLALEEQYSKLQTEHTNTMHSLDELGEQYSVLDLNHKKVLNQLDSVSKQQDGQAIKTRKADLRVANLEEIHQFNDKQYVSKEHVKQIVENIVEEVKSAQSSAAALTNKTAELSQIVENVINALLNLGSDNSLQISLLQTMTSEQYKANISALLTDSIQGNITATIQSMYKGTQDQIQNSILLCIKDMREHNEALLRPFIEDQRTLAATVNRVGNEVEQVKLFVKTHSTLKPNEQSPEVRDRVSAMEAGVGKMEEALATLQRTCATFTPAIASVDSKYEKHLIVLENTLDIYKTRLETMTDNQKASASAVNAVESSLDNCRKDMAFLRNDINPDLFMNHNKLIQDMQLQCNTLLTDFYALKTATENSMNSALQTVNEQVFQFGNEQSKKHNQLASNLDDYKQSLNESIKGMREQVSQCAASVLPMESTVTTLQADVKQLVNNYTGISEDVSNRYDRLLKERNENKAYMDSREAGYNKFITDKFNNLEAGQQAWAAQMEKVLHDLQQSSQEDRLRLLEDGMSRLSVTVSDQTNSLRIDNMDINLRKEMDRLKHEQLKVVSDLQERIANSNKQADHKHTELADTVRTNTNKLHSQLDGLTSELSKVSLQLTDTDGTLGKYGSKLVGLEGKLEEQGERLLNRLHDRTTSLEGQMREHREDLLARCNTLDSQLAAHTKGTGEQLDIVRSMLVKQEKALISKMEADLITVREQYTAFTQAEVNTASKAWGLQHKVEMDDVNESIQTILSQHLQFTNILDTLEDSINQSKAELAKNKDLLTLEILGNRDKASSSINKIYKDLNGELEEVKYDLTQMANKYQLLEQYMQSGSIGVGAGSGTGAGAGADSSMLGMKLDQLERAVHEHHKLFPAHVQEVLTKYLSEQKHTDSHSELVSSSVNRMHIAMSELQNQLKAQESRCCGLIDGVDRKASASVSQLLIKCAALEECFVSNKEYVPAMDRLQKSLQSFQSQLDSLQEEVVDLGHQTEQLTESVAQAVESATAAHSAVQDIDARMVQQPAVSTVVQEAQHKPTQSATTPVRDMPATAARSAVPEPVSYVIDSLPQSSLQPIARDAPAAVMASSPERIVRVQESPPSASPKHDQRSVSMFTPPKSKAPPLDHSSSFEEDASPAVSPIARVPATPERGPLSPNSFDDSAGSPQHHDNSLSMSEDDDSQSDSEHEKSAYDKQIDHVMAAIGTIPPTSPGGSLGHLDQLRSKDSDDSNDLEDDFQRIQDYVGSGAKSKNQQEDEEHESMSHDEHDDDEFVSDSDESEEEEDEEGPEHDDSEEEEVSPITPPTPTSPTAAAARTMQLSGPTISHIPHIGRLGAPLPGSASSAPVLSGSLLTRSRMGLPMPGASAAYNR